MNIIRRTEPPSIQVDDCKTKLDFEILAEEISKALEGATKNLPDPE